MTSFSNHGHQDLVLALSEVIVTNRDMLSEIDGRIGDGDHGINMAKGFRMAAERIDGRLDSFATNWATR